MSSLWVVVAFLSFLLSILINSQRSGTQVVNGFWSISPMLCMYIPCIVNLFLVSTAQSLYFPFQSMNSGDDLISIWRWVNFIANQPFHCFWKGNENTRVWWDQSPYLMNPSSNVVIIWLFLYMDLNLSIYYIRPNTLNDIEDPWMFSFLSSSVCTQDYHGQHILMFLYSTNF